MFELHDCKSTTVLKRAMEIKKKIKFKFKFKCSFLNFLILVSECKKINKSNTVLHILNEFLTIGLMYYPIIF